MKKYFKVSLSIVFVSVLLTYGTYIFAAPLPPSLSSPTSSTIKSTQATLGATVTGAGTSALTEIGTCWGLTIDPTSNCISAGSPHLGAFTHIRAGLTPSTKYYYRGYAKNSEGRTGYSASGSFTTTSGSGSSAINLASTSYNANIGANVSFGYTADFRIDEVAKTTECRLLDNNYSPLTNWQMFGPIVYAAPMTSGSYGYFIRCTDTPASLMTATSAKITVTVPSPTVTVYANGANPLTVNYGDTVRITWTSSNATSCIRNDTGAGIVVKDMSVGFSVPNISASKTFTITCYN